MATNANDPWLDAVRMLDRALQKQGQQVDTIKHLVIGLERDQRERRRPGRPGGLVARHAAVAVKGFLEHQSPEDIAHQLYPGDRELGRLIERAATNPAVTGTPAWAGELAAVTVADILTNILPASVLSQLRARSGMAFAFVDGSVVKVPMHTATPNGSFVGESLPIPVATMLLSSLSLPVRKAASISAFTRELAAGSPGNVEQAFQILLQQDLGLAVDQVLLDSNPATTVRPAGLLNGLTTLTPSATGTLFEKIVADVKTLLSAIAPAALPTLIVGATQAAMFDLAAPPGLAKIASVSVPAGKVIMVDAAAFVSAMGEATFNVSENPLVHMEDTAPLPFATGAQGSAVVAAPSMSMWQAEATSLRCILDVNWALRRANAVSFMTGVGW